MSDPESEPIFDAEFREPGSDDAPGQPPAQPAVPAVPSMLAAIAPPDRADPLAAGVAVLVMAALLSCVAIVLIAAGNG